MRVGPASADQAVVSPRGQHAQRRRRERRRDGGAAELNEKAPAAGCRFRRRHVHPPGRRRRAGGRTPSRWPRPTRGTSRTPTDRCQAALSRSGSTAVRSRARRRRVMAPTIAPSSNAGSSDRRSRAKNTAPPATPSRKRPAIAAACSAVLAAVPMLATSSARLTATDGVDAEGDDRTRQRAGGPVEQVERRERQAAQNPPEIRHGNERRREQRARQRTVPHPGFCHSGNGSQVASVASAFRRTLDVAEAGRYGRKFLRDRAVEDGRKYILRSSPPEVLRVNTSHQESPEAEADTRRRRRETAARIRVRRSKRIRSLSAVRRFPQRQPRRISGRLPVASASRHRNHHLRARRPGGSRRQPRQQRHAVGR